MSFKFIKICKESCEDENVVEAYEKMLDFYHGQMKPKKKTKVVNRMISSYQYVGLVNVVVSDIDKRTKNEAKLDKTEHEFEKSAKNRGQGYKRIENGVQTAFPDRLDNLKTLNEVKLKSKSTPGCSIRKIIENRTRKT
ncbi:hypothetical protein Tco_0012894 [Tanacetum coccineum]